MKTQHQKFIEKVVRIRQFLLNADKSKRSDYNMIADMYYLQHQCQAVTFTEAGAKQFFLKVKNRVLNIMPGADCKTYMKLMNEYLTLLNNAAIETT